MRDRRIVTGSRVLVVWLDGDALNWRRNVTWNSLTRILSRWVEGTVLDDLRWWLLVIELSLKLRRGRHLLLIGILYCVRIDLWHRNLLHLWCLNNELLIRILYLRHSYLSNVLMGYNNLLLLNWDTPSNQDIAASILMSIFDTD